MAVLGERRASSRRRPSLRRQKRLVRSIGFEKFTSASKEQRPPGRPTVRRTRICSHGYTLRRYQVYGVQRLSPQEIDGYFRETALVATKLGALRVPKSANEVARYLQRLRPELVADEKTASVLVSIKSAPAPHLCTHAPKTAGFSSARNPLMKYAVTAVQSAG